MTLPDPYPVLPCDGPIRASVRVPGSKSETNRVYALAALAEGTSVIEHPLRADDCDRLLRAVETLGASVVDDGDRVRITGTGGHFRGGGRLDLGDGGTPARFCLALASLADAPVVVDGSPRMRERPVAEGIGLLRELGAVIDDEGRGALPVRCGGGRPRGGSIEVPTTQSSQFISAAMLIAPWLESGVDFTFTGDLTSAAYVRLTESIMLDWGIDVTRRGDRLSIAHGAPSGRNCAVHADASSAVYFAAAATIIPGSRIELLGCDLDDGQPDAAILRLLGARPSPGGIVLEHGAVPWPATIDACDFPDGSLVLAAIAARAAGPTTISGLKTLRVKETDRIAALATELERIGCTVTVHGDDAIHIDPSTAHENPVVVPTYNDHRMAMSFAILGLARGGISIADPGCVAKSYPNFFADLAGVCGGPLIPPDSDLP